MARFVILTAGFTNPHTAKTAVAMLRYRGEEVVALYDDTQAGRTAGELLGVGGATPIVGSLEGLSADSLLIGIAPPGGRIPPPWRSVILEALGRGMHVVSGLHEFLGDDSEFTAVAQAGGGQLSDLRRNTHKQIARRGGLREECLRILTVGNDCSVGKMVAAWELVKGLNERGAQAKFLATGQTGILLAGGGAPVDAVVADFVSGAVEQLVLAEQDDHEVLVVEGQASLAHPSYSGVTLSLLHGAFPHGLILVYEVGRTHVAGLPQVEIPPLAEVIRLNETMGGLFGRPCPVIGLAMNGRLVSAEEVEAEKERRAEEFGLPVCDVFRHGPGPLVEAVLKLKQERGG